MEYVIAIALGTVGSLVATEIYAALPRISHQLLRRVAARLPESEQANRLEEWVADNNDFSTNLGKAWHALHCYFHIRSISHAFSELFARKNTLALEIRDGADQVVIFLLSHPDDDHLESLPSPSHGNCRWPCG